MASINLQGDTSGSISISAPSVAGSNTLTLPATTQTLATQNALGVRNLIINGDIRIAQRGTSTTSISSANTYYTVDRVKTIIGSAGTWTQTQDSSVPTGQGFAKSLKMDCTTASASLAAGAYALLQYRLEGQNLQHLKKGTSSAESVTLSFWVKSNKTGTYITNIEDQDNTRHICKSYTIDTADTWEKKTITYDGDATGTLDNDNGASLNIIFWMAAGSDRSSGTLATSWASNTTANRAVGQVNLADSTSNYINITGVQLEVGDTATPFEHRPYDMELARCQRYYEKSYDIGTTPGTATQNGNLSTVTSSNSSNQMDGARFKVRKRAVPTCTAYNAVSGASGGCYRYNDGANIGLTFNGVGETAAGRATLASNSANTYLWHFVAEAEL